MIVSNFSFRFHCIAISIYQSIYLYLSFCSYERKLKLETQIRLMNDQVRPVGDDILIFYPHISSLESLFVMKSILLHLLLLFSYNFIAAMIHQQTPAHTGASAERVGGAQDHAAQHAAPAAQARFPDRRRRGDAQGARRVRDQHGGRAVVVRAAVWRYAAAVGRREDQNA